MGAGSAALSGCAALSVFAASRPRRQKRRWRADLAWRPRSQVVAASAWRAPFAAPSPCRPPRARSHNRLPTASAEARQEAVAAIVGSGVAAMQRGRDLGAHARQRAARGWLQGAGACQRAAVGAEAAAGIGHQPRLIHAELVAQPADDGRIVDAERTDCGGGPQRRVRGKQRRKALQLPAVVYACALRTPVTRDGGRHVNRSP